MSSLVAIDYAGRLDLVRDALDRLGHGAMLVTEPVNIRWLTGFTGSAGRLAVLADRAALITDGRYTGRAVAELTAAGVDADVVTAATATDQRDALVARFATSATVAAEGNRLAYDTYTSLAEVLPLRSVSGVIEDLRRVKNAGERARMAAAARCADLALGEVLGAPASGRIEGMTEREVQIELDYQMQRHGASGPGFDTIVAAGPEHAARPHHEVTERRIQAGDTVVIDMGATVDGYRSDMTRSFVMGTPSVDQRDRFDVLIAAQAAGVDAVGPGVEARAVDAAARSVLVGAGLGDLYLHGTGHGVGLEIHEHPYIGATSSDLLAAGEVITVEPGVYEPGFGGFRIEDLVEVTDEGHRVLTQSPISIDAAG